MNNDELKKRMVSLYHVQDRIARDNEILLPEYEQEQVILPEFSGDGINFEVPVFKDLEKLEDLDDSVFAKWKPADIPAMIATGILGTFTSAQLQNFTAGLHDKWGKLPTLEGGHSGELIDKVPGNKQPGGFGHRWKFGHDLLNPFEVDWEQYKTLANQSGSPIPACIKTPFYWTKHLFQDSFSKEGLPIPGNSLSRYFLNPADKSTREMLQTFGTVKMRDNVGAGLTNFTMKAYLWGTEADFSNVLFKPNYRVCSLMLGAHIVTLLSGLLAPPPFTSFNWGTIPKIVYYFFELIKLNKEIKRILSAREVTLNENALIQFNNDILLQNYILEVDKYCSEVLEYEDEVEKFYLQVTARHNALKKRILMEA
jgi:hypothetical protein